jgi:calcineurin-like phosphoesterase family protein
MKTWIISDTHFGHRKLEEWGRPADFEKLIFKGLKQIGADDLVIHLGDFCIGDDVKWHNAFFSVLSSNKRILVKGNHDHKSNTWYLEHGWHFVCDEFSDVYFGKKILFTHEPRRRYKNSAYGVFDFNYHGHLHGNAHRLDDEVKEWYDNTYNKDFSADVMDYKPYLLK